MNKFSVFRVLGLKKASKFDVFQKFQKSIFIFENFSKMKILVFEIFEKGQILRPFSGLAPSKLDFFFQKKGRLRVYKGIVWYLFHGLWGVLKNGSVTLNHATSIKFRPFSSLAPSNLKIFQKISRVGYVCIEESFETTFNMGGRLSKIAHD